MDMLGNTIDCIIGLNTLPYHHFFWIWPNFETETCQYMLWLIDPGDCGYFRAGLVCCRPEICFAAPNLLVFFHSNLPFALFYSKLFPWCWQKGACCKRGQNSIVSLCLYQVLDTCLDWYDIYKFSVNIKWSLMLGKGWTTPHFCHLYKKPVTYILYPISDSYH